MPQKNCYYLYFYCLFPGQNPTNTFKNRFWGWSCTETKLSSLHHRHLSSKESARIYRKFNVLVAPVMKQYWYKTSLMLVGGNNWTSQLLRLEEKLSHCRYKQDLNKERESENIQKRFRYCPTLNHNNTSSVSPPHQRRPPCFYVSSLCSGSCCDSGRRLGRSPVRCWTPAITRCWWTSTATWTTSQRTGPIRN